MSHCTLALVVTQEPGSQLQKNKTDKDLARMSQEKGVKRGDASIRWLRKGSATESSRNSGVVSKDITCTRDGIAPEVVGRVHRVEQKVGVGFTDF